MHFAKGVIFAQTQNRNPSVRDIPALADREELETSSTDARARPQPVVVTPKQALSIKPFGLDMDVLLTTEATGGATSVIVAWHKPGEGPPDHAPFQTRGDFVHY